MMSDSQRREFDALLDRIIAQLPEHLRQLLEEVPLIVEDEPSLRLMDELGLDRAHSELCGLHHGVALTQRSVETPTRMPDRMMIFRGPIMRLSSRRIKHRHPSDQALLRQIRITLLHEMGHHFGLDEEDLAALGYG